MSETLIPPDVPPASEGAAPSEGAFEVGTFRVEAADSLYRVLRTMQDGTSVLDMTTDDLTEAQERCSYLSDRFDGEEGET